MFMVGLNAALFCLCLFCVKVLSKVAKQCSSDITGSEICSGEKEYCDPVSRKCQCLPNYTEENNQCIPLPINPDCSDLADNRGNGSLIAGILIPLFLIIIVICSIYVVKRYELGTWIRSKLHRRNHNYDEVMIGQDLNDDDDPPLA
ncbi:uncharacterized protein LOC132706137 [Cylas formicarius]|uniref:uncharacterized protein LOC132706137 n=1 Tax=Cylas formicarius TaxID=197179 RepID=UPI0029585F25|nr:uncharacterized protein LOC132706137 [Cylas formicarius]XP_060533279.1 uncharacterized protein LOC132706137 [Cylas formicarius]